MSKHDKRKEQLENLIASDLPTGERLEKFMDMVDTDKLYEELAMKADIAKQTGLPLLSIADNFVATIMEVYKPEWFNKPDSDHLIPPHIEKMVDELFALIQKDLKAKKKRPDATNTATPEKKIVADLFKNDKKAS